MLANQVNCSQERPKEATNKYVRETVSRDQRISNLPTAPSNTTEIKITLREFKCDCQKSEYLGK